MNLKKLSTSLILGIFSFGIFCGSFASASKQTAKAVNASNVPEVVVTNSDMGFKTISSGTGPYVGYSEWKVEGENLNMDEVNGDAGYDKFEVATGNLDNTSGGKCTAHIYSGYMKFNLTIQGGNHVKVRFWLRLANINGGSASNYYALQVGSKEATKYYPSGDLIVGKDTSYSYWAWDNFEVEQDFYLDKGTTTIYLTNGSSSFTNLDCVYIRVIGDDQPVLNSLGNVRLEAEYLDSSSWSERTDMINAGRDSFIEVPGSGLSPATSNDRSIARFQPNNTFTLNFSAEADANFSLSMVMAQYEDNINWNDRILITLDGTPMPNPTPGIVGGHTTSNLYYYWMSANLGDYSVTAGNHSIGIKIVGMPNIDCFDFTVTKYNGIGVDQIVSEQPSVAVEGNSYASNVSITDANPVPTRGFNDINGASFETTRLLLTVTDEVSYFEGNYVGVNAACASEAAVMKVYCGSNLLGTQKLASSPVEYKFSLSNTQSGYIQIEITGSGQDTIYVKWLTVFGYATGNVFSDAAVATYGATFSANLTCDGIGSRTYDEATWNSLKASFEALDVEIQRIIAALPGSEASEDALTKALGRYDFIIAKYAGVDYTNDFIGRTYNAEALYKFSSNPFGFNLANNSSTMLIVVIAFAIAAVSAVPAVLFIRRRRAR